MRVEFILFSHSHPDFLYSELHYMIAERVSKITELGL